MINTINEISESVIKLLKSDKGLVNIVTEIYDFIPNKAPLPYMYIYISTLKTLNLFNNNNMSKMQLVCKIYCYQSSILYTILNIITNLLKNYKLNISNLEYKIIPEYSYNINQYQEVIYALLNFTILAKETYVNTTTH